jgi:RHS repeat-associated protein
MKRTLMEKIEANLRGSSTVTSFVKNIDYNAKGQRTLIEYGNSAWTEYSYDMETFRLTDLNTYRGKRAVPPVDCAPTLDPRTCIDPPGACPQLNQNRCILQKLHYTYDPTGNITNIRDDAQQTIYFSNKRVEPSGDYTYDAIYRLIEARGREHLGQTNNQANPPTPPDAFNGFQTNLAHPGDGNAMGTYIEHYVYDAVGNFLSMQHRGSDPSNPGWSRAYSYNEPSLLEQGKKSNRLTSTRIGQITENYGYDGNEGLHGNITFMPHLPVMRWDFHDQLQATAKQVVTDGGIPETTYYVYDASGQRVRKVTESAATAADSSAGRKPVRIKERIYLGGFEIYREYDSKGKTLERESIHIMDDKRRVALVETKTIDTSVPANTLPEVLKRYQFDNHLGSACLELDDAAAIISYEEFYPYGSTSYQAVNRSIRAAAKRYRYTGKERDDENGFYYHGARYYAPWVGRWTAVDPEPKIISLSTYTYCDNSPACATDKNGRTSIKIGVQDTTFSYTLDHGISQDTIDTQKLNQQLKASASNLGLLPGSDNFSKKHLADTPFPIRPQSSLSDAFTKGTDAFRKAALEIFKGSLKDVKELNDLWQEASRNETNTYETSRSNFYTDLRTSSNPNAVWIRNAFAAIGIDFDPKSRLPRIKPESIFPKNLLDKMSGERKNPTQRMMRAIVATAQKAVNTGQNIAVKTESTAKAIAGTVKQTAKSMIPGSDVYDVVKEVGGGSVKSGVSILMEYSKSIAGQGVQAIRQYGAQAIAVGSAVATAAAGAAQAAFSATSLSGIAAAGAGAVAVSAGAVALAGALGYGIGTALNKLVVDPLIDKIVPESLYEWSYRTFYK